MKNSLRDQMATRGLGAGIPQNQALAGAQNPVLAAAMAAQNPGQVAESIDQQELLKEEIERKVLHIKDSMEDGFVPSIDPDEALKESEDKLLDVYDELIEWQKTKIDEEDYEEEEEKNVDVDDPLYNPLRDKVRRKALEQKLEPLDFENMIFKGFCVQEIPIRSNFKIVFRTLNTHQSLWIESMTLDLANRSVQYGRHWMSLVQLAVCLMSVNGKPIPPEIWRYTKASQEKAFKKALVERMDYIGTLPQVITDDLIVQFSWFLSRVRKMLTGDVVEKVGN